VGLLIDFLYPRGVTGFGGPVPAGKVTELTKGGAPKEFPIGQFWLVNLDPAETRPGGSGGGDGILALWRKCPHLGCQVPQLCDQSQWFECLCHGSKYTVLGEKRDGPAPRGMDRFAVEVEDGVYYINSAELEDGPPVGTSTFDTRGPSDMPHCAA
jgi:cytochrome b6-f complex iron-sulfur subunit